MGCWSEKIFGGDVSLKWKEQIYEICKTKEYNSKNKEKSIPSKKLESKISEIVKLIDSNMEEDERNIGYIVLGALIMSSGANLSDNIKKKISEAADGDGWSKENHLRKIVINNYKKIIKEYDYKAPVNLDTINNLKEIEDTEEDLITSEFKSLFGIMNARIKKLKKGIEEVSGVVEYDEGYADASQEEIDFLTDFKEMIERQEQLAVILDRIEKGMNIPTYSGEVGAKTSSNASGNGSMSGGKDVLVG